jgi:LysR family hydrogen peroxide-inducible transcriptional activator
MTLTELRYVAVLAKTQHFGNAAEQCNVSQPTLSIAIKKLESELGVEIFERTATHVFLTRMGTKIIAQCHKVLDEVAIIRDIAVNEEERLSSSLRIGAIFTIGPYLFPNFVSPLQKSAPNMPLIIEEGYTNSLRERLRKGKLDVAILCLPFEEPDVVVQPLLDEPDVVVQPLLDEPFVVVMPPNHPLAQYSSLNPKDLEKEHILLLGEGHCFRVQVIDAIPNINQHHHAAMPIDTDSQAYSLETLCTMVATGFGITVLPQTAVKGKSICTVCNSDLVSIPFESDGPKRTLAIAWRAGFPRYKAIEAVRNAIYASYNLNSENKQLPKLAYE